MTANMCIPFTFYGVHTLFLIIVSFCCYIAILFYILPFILFIICFSWFLQMSDDEITSSSSSRRSQRSGRKSGKNHHKYRKDKPWDSEEIDHWHVDEWKDDYMSHAFLEETSFATLFPKYRENYLRFCGCHFYVYLCTCDM